MVVSRRERGRGHWLLAGERGRALVVSRRGEALVVSRREERERERGKG